MFDAFFSLAMFQPINIVSTPPKRTDPVSGESLDERSKNLWRAIDERAIRPRTYNESILKSIFKDIPVDNRFSINIFLALLSRHEFQKILGLVDPPYTRDEAVRERMFLFDVCDHLDCVVNYESIIAKLESSSFVNFTAPVWIEDIPAHSVSQSGLVTAPKLTCACDSLVLERIFSSRSCEPRFFTIVHQPDAMSARQRFSLIVKHHRPTLLQMLLSPFNAEYAGAVRAILANRTTDDFRGFFVSSQMKKSLEKNSSYQVFKGDDNIEHKFNAIVKFDRNYGYPRSTVNARTNFMSLMARFGFGDLIGEDTMLSETGWELLEKELKKTEWVRTFFEGTTGSVPSRQDTPALIIAKAGNFELSWKDMVLDPMAPQMLSVYMPVDVLINYVEQYDNMIHQCELAASTKDSQVIAHAIKLYKGSKLSFDPHNKSPVIEDIVKMKISPNLENENHELIKAGVFRKEFFVPSLVRQGIIDLVSVRIPDDYPHSEMKRQIEEVRATCKKYNWISNGMKMCAI